MNTKEKYEDIKVSMLPEKTRDTLEKIRRATKDFSVSNEKADAYVSAVHSKLKKEKPDALRSEDIQKAQKPSEPKKTEPKKTKPKQSSATKPTPKSEPTPEPTPKPTKAQIVKVKESLSKLEEAIANDPLLKGLGKTDKQRDASRTALPLGRRVSKKGWKNQYGGSSGGRVYYENRENRSDRKSPEYKSGYPYLELGGYTHKNDVDGEFYVNIYTESDGKIVDVKEREYRDKDSAMTFAMMKGNFLEKGQSIFVMDDEGNVLYKKVSMKSKGGYMAKGGEINSENIVSPKLDMKDFIGKKLTIELGSSGKTQVWNQEDFLEQIGKVLLHNLYDTDFAYSEFTDMGDVYRRNVLNSAVLPLIEVDEINKTLNDFFKYGFTPYSSREKVLFFKLNSKDTRKWIDNWFETTKDNPPKVIKMDELKKEYYYFRLDYTREKPYILERGGYMADGGEMRSYKTFVEEYPDKKIYVRVKFAGADKDVQHYTANEENKKRAISFAKRLAEKNNGTYEGFKTYTYAKGGYMAKGGIVVTSIKDIPNFQERLDEGKITYRGLGIGKLYNNFYDIAGESGYRIKVDGKEYYITESEFNSFSRGSDGKLRVKFDAPYRKFQNGGYMAKGEDYEYINTFKRFDSNVDVPDEDFKKFVDAWHEQKEGDELDKAKYRVLKRSMGNYLGHKTVQDMEDYVEKTHDAARMEYGGYMAKGGDTNPIISNFGKEGTGFDNPKYKGSYDPRGVMLKPTTDLKTLGSKLVVTKLSNGSYKWDLVLQNGDIYQTKTGFNTSDDAINDYMKSSYAKGGNVYSSDDAYEAIVLKDGVEVDRVVLRGRNKGEAREMYEDVYESKMMKKHGEGIAYEIIIAPSKMAKGGTLKVIKDSDKNQGRLHYERFEGAIGSYGYIYEKRYLEGILYPLDDFDKDYYSHLKLKRDEKLFRYKTERVAFDWYFPLVKINLDKMLIYFLEDSDDDKNPTFNSRGTKLDYLIIEEAYYNVTEYAEGGELAMGIKTEMEEHGMSKSEATETAKDHLREHSNYYSKMKKAGLEDGGRLELFAKGGKLGFEGLSNKVAARYEGKKVSPKYQSEYGKTYDKEEAKEVGDKVAAKVYRKQLSKMEHGGETEGKLPHTLNKYFKKSKETKTFPMSSLIPIRAREKGIANAEKYMRMAYDGEMERRKPITVYKSRNNKYRIYDGNSTYAVAKKNGWKTIYADVIPNPNITKRKENSVFNVAKQIRKEGESWNDAIRRASKLNK